MAAGGLGSDRRMPEPMEAVHSTWRIGGVPVLLYHGILADGAPAPQAADPRYVLRASAFQKQLTALRGARRAAALLDEVWAEGWTEPHRRPAIFTFDDGRVSDFEVAFPLLLQAKACAEFFVNTATIGTAGYLSWAQLRTMQQGGMSVQSHGHDHVILMGLSAARLRGQLWDSRRLLEDALGTAVRYLAAPYGLVNRRIRAAALDAGYRAVCSSGEWMARPGARIVSRLALYSSTTLDEFRQLLQGTVGPLARRRLRVGLAYVPKRVLLRLRRRSLERDV